MTRIAAGEVLCEACAGKGEVPVGPRMAWSPTQGFHASARDEMGPCRDCNGQGSWPGCVNHPGRRGHYVAAQDAWICEDCLLNLPRE